MDQPLEQQPASATARLRLSPEKAEAVKYLYFGATALGSETLQRAVDDLPASLSMLLASGDKHTFDGMAAKRAVFLKTLADSKLAYGKADDKADKQEVIFSFPHRHNGALVNVAFDFVRGSSRAAIALTTHFTEHNSDPMTVIQPLEEARNAFIAAEAKLKEMLIGPVTAKEIVSDGEENPIDQLCHSEVTGALSYHDSSDVVVQPEPSAIDSASLDQAAKYADQMASELSHIIQQIKTPRQSAQAASMRAAV